mgnify:CR=1 FL=1
MMSQCNRVLQHLQAYGSITPLEAMQEYGIMRLGARIYDLKKMGYSIDRIIETGKNRYGESTSYARYSLNEKEKDK